MDNFDLKKYLAEGKLHENVNQDEKSQLMDFVKNLQDVFSSGDIQYPIFVDSLDPELYDDGSDLIKNFVKYLSHKYSYDEVTPLEIDGGDVEDFLRSKFNEINEGDHSLDMVLNEMVNEEDEMTPQMKEDEERLEYFKIAQIYGINSTTFGIEWYYKFDDMDGEDKYYHEFNVGEGGTDEDAEYAAYLYTLTNLS